MAYDIVCPHCGKRDYYHESWCKVWDNHHTRKEKPENEEVDMTDWADEAAWEISNEIWVMGLRSDIAAMLRKVRADALEEAAGLCEGPATGDVIRTTEEDNIRFELADAIRALKDKP